MITTREGLVPNRFAAALHSRTNILEYSPEHGTMEVLKPRPEALRRSWLVMAFEFMMSVCGLVDEKICLASFAKGDLDGSNLSRHRPRDQRHNNEVELHFQDWIRIIRRENFFHWDRCR